MGNVPPFLAEYKYSLLFGIYLTITSGAIFRIARRPYVRSIKADQIETVFKATTLAAVIAGVAISGRINKTRNQNPFLSLIMSADFWAGYISGATAIVIGNPLDLIKVRLQAGTSITANVPSSYTSQFTGAGSLIRGATAPILGYGALNALLFVTYNRTTALLNGYLPTAPSLSAVWTAGAVGGLASWVVSTPSELVKCRTQISNAGSSLGIAQEIFRTEGVRGFYFGGVVTALRDSIGYGFYFWSYEWSTRLMASQAGETSSRGEEAAKVLLCGGLAGVVTWASIFPLDVIKTRVQTQVLHSTENTPLIGVSNPAVSNMQHSRIGAIAMARKTYHNEGATVFFRGLTVCSVRAFIVNAAQWAVYEWIMRALDAGRKSPLKQATDAPST